MYRKIIGLLAIIVIGFFAFKLLNNEPVIESTSALLMDATTGKVLYEKNAATSYPVASMSKMMTEYIVLDYLEAGKIAWNDEVVMSGAAMNVGEGAAKIPVSAGDRLTVRDLFTAMVVSSANNAAIALAEYIAESEKEFTGLMNEKAERLGLTERTHFVNATGLPNADQAENSMSAKDVATLAYHLLKDHENTVTEVANLQHYHIPSHGIDIYNTNKMLNEANGSTYYKGLDGLKTGFTDAAGYCFTGTASKDGKRLISVIIQAKDDETRFVETKKLLSFGFGEFISPSLKEEVAFLIKGNR